MKKKTIVILVAVFGILALIFGITVGSYNGLVNSREEVRNSWSDISVELQARADKIPNLLETVKGYTDYEQSTLIAVTQARSEFNEEKNDINDRIEAYDEMQSAFNVWVNAVTEAYPELKADKQFTALTDEITGSENRIAYAREQYNEKVRKYNSSIKKFPKSIIAEIFDFDDFDYFEAQGYANEVPEVSFD